MRLLVVLAAVSVGLQQPVLAAECGYRTVAGKAVTFQGNGTPVSLSLFDNPRAIIGAGDGTIYIADTGNNRIRRITTTGIVQTIAGKGEPAFAGDGGPATTAALNQPQGLALASDGTLYIADTANQRVRAISPGGVIRTVAGEGHARFGGDGGDALQASLNTPVAITRDSAGNLFIADSVNGRIRRVGSDGKIATVAGNAGVDDYNPVQGLGNAPAPGAGTATPLYSPTTVSAGPNGDLYIADGSGLHHLDASGQLSTVVAYPILGEQTVVTPTPIGDVKIRAATPVVLPDGSLVLIAATQALHVSDGLAYPLHFSDVSTWYGAGADLSTGGLVVLDLYSLIVQRLALNGAATNLNTYQLQDDPTKAQTPLDLNLDGATAIAVAPDHTIYIGGQNTGATTGRILALAPDGKANVIASLSRPPSSIAADSKGNVYVAIPTSFQVLKIARGGTPQVFYTDPLGYIGTIRTDAQDRLYIYANETASPLVRLDPSGARTVLIGPLVGVGLSLPVFVYVHPMTVAPDGTVYLIFQTSSQSSVYLMKLAAGTTGNPVPLLPDVSIVSLAVSPAGELYMNGDQGQILKLQKDGSTIVVHGGDQYGFHGEFGFDSALEITPWIGEMAFDSSGDLLATDKSTGSLKRIPLSTCTIAPAPSVAGVAESATGDGSLKLAAGQIFTIYGTGLGPDQGASTSFDPSGHLPKQFGGTEVTVNGVAAPLLYVSAKQINAIVPFDLAGQEAARVVVTNGGIASDPWVTQIGYYGPGIFSYPLAGYPTMRFAVMLNADGTLNDATHPAKPGTVVTFYATGTGATDPAGEDGAQAGLILKRPVLPVTIWVGFDKVTPLYADTAPTLVEGLAQINLPLPASISTGPVDISIQMGQGITSAVTTKFYVAQ